MLTLSCQVQIGGDDFCGQTRSHPATSWAGQFSVECRIDHTLSPAH